MSFAALVNTFEQQNWPLLFALAAALAVLLAWLIVRWMRRLRRQPFRRVGALWSGPQGVLYFALREAAGDQAVVLLKVQASAVLGPREDLSRGDRQRALRRIAGRHLEYLLCDPSGGEPRVAVALQAAGGSPLRRHSRDRVLKSACQSAGLPLIFVPALPKYSAADLRQRLHPCLAARAAAGWGLISPQAAMAVPAVDPPWENSRQPGQSVPGRAPSGSPTLPPVDDASAGPARVEPVLATTDFEAASHTAAGTTAEDLESGDPVAASARERGDNDPRVSSFRLRE